MAKIQLGIHIDANQDGHDDVRLTPVDIEAPDDVVAAARVLEQYLDSQDSKPGDGEGDLDGTAKVPVNILFVRADITIKGGFFIKVVED